MSAAALRQLMYEVGRTEIECQDFLRLAGCLLVPPMSEVLQVVREQQGMAGRSDYFVICREITGRRSLFIWEAKAPQLAPFVAETANRVAPSAHLVGAESQLLHYYDEYRGSEQFRDRYQLGGRQDIHLGGIIIGRDDNQVEGQSAAARGLDDTARLQLASLAQRIRMEHFYRDAMRILSWDCVLRALEQLERQNAPALA